MGGYENETDAARETRIKEYWDGQKNTCSELKSTDDSLGDILNYIKDQQEKDPMLVPGLVTKYDTPVNKGGGCVVS